MRQGLTDSVLSFTQGMVNWPHCEKTSEPQHVISNNVAF